MPLPEPGCRRNGPSHEVKGTVDGQLKGIPEGKPGRYPRREGAPCAVRVPGGKAGAPPDALLLAVPEQVHEFVPLAVAAFDQRRSRSHLHERPGRLPLSGLALHRKAREDPGLIQVRRHEGCPWHQERGHGPLCIPVQQAVAGGGDHDRVQHVAPERMGLEERGHLSNEFGGGQHPRLDGARGQVLHHGIHLVPDHDQRHRVHAPHPHGILRRQRRDGAGPEHTEGVEGLEVSLDPGAPAAVATGNGESHGHPQRSARTGTHTGRSPRNSIRHAFLPPRPGGRRPDATPNAMLPDARFEPAR